MLDREPHEALTDTTIFATNEPARYTGAFDRLTVVASDARQDGRLALVKCAVERFDLCCPELESAGLVSVTAECDLRWSIREHVDDLYVCSEDFVRPCRSRRANKSAYS